MATDGASWAIVVGIDEYGSDKMRLGAAVSDAVAFRDWVVSERGGRVPPSNVRMLLGRRSDDRATEDAGPAPTKDNLVTAINDVVLAAGGRAERLFFYFAGHGITARVSNRDESALVTVGFDELHTDHSLAVRSLTEHFETTPFADQFFIIDACRNVPWADREFEIGRWPVPRRRDPGALPVQQFMLYATSPGQTAHEVGWPGEAQGAFTGVLMEALAGSQDAKAWSWERDRYEVRWERLTSYVNRRMLERSPPPAGVSAADWPIQIPQDAGARGVADPTRDRDAVVVWFPRGSFKHLELTLALEADDEFEEAQISVLDAVGEPVASALKVTGSAQTFTLPPKTYAVRAVTTAPGELVGTLKAPVDLYVNCRETIRLRPQAAPPDEVAEPVHADDLGAAGGEQPPGTIEIRSVDPLALALIQDEAGRAVGVAQAGEDVEAKPGFYRIRQVGPEETLDAGFVVLRPSGRDEVCLRPPEPPRHVAALATALGGRIDGDGCIRLEERAEPIAWARPSTLAAAGVAAALTGAQPRGLAVDDLQEALGRAAAGVAVLAVAGDGRADAVGRLRVRIWRTGDAVPGTCHEPELSAAGIAAVVQPVASPGPHWASIEFDGIATVVSLPVLPGRLATLVAELGADRVRLYQFHPVAGPGASSSVDRLRRVERLQRLLLAGRLDGAERLATDLAGAASDDPFTAVLAGYTLLRFGRHEDLPRLVQAVNATAPELADGYILRGEYEASTGRPDLAAQSFAAAVNAGIPAFAEGLTRLTEGLRTSSYPHPRAALVRHVFQRHARGSMWAAFTPARPLEPGRLVISGADLGFEG